MIARLRLVAAVAVLAAGVACRTGATPYRAPAPAGAPLLDRTAAGRLAALVVAESDPQVTPPWVEKAGQVADAVAAALGEAGFRTVREGRRWSLRVTASALLRGGDFAILVDDGRGNVLERWVVTGGAWGSEELAELGRAARERLERSQAVAALAGVAAPAAPRVAAPAQPPAPPGAKRLAVLDFRGAVPAPILALLADQARAEAAEAARASGVIVLSRDAVVAALREKGRPAEPCADGPCELETARAVGVALVVTGEVTAVGDARVLVLKLVDAGSGALVASRHAQARDDLALVEAARVAAAALFR